ncbi:hypothetical protein FZEAL_1164 [Fusarium zealandicum]|uniref:Mediator of RNA polymerase II transcription subunit 11 n=1 Tax=Fusarium zealandicum TaxID=1053134 RepID=A0A8H4XP35_9HYPO|nr:hypothetical protein FZEAL_1164 [Fusarium zealandicum]
MASPKDVVMDDSGESRIHEPFTVEENIQQLNALDNYVVQLMSHTATALNALTTPTNGASNSDLSAEAAAAKPSLDPPSQKAAFRSATDSFLTTLHAVDVKMKRQIMALEEAGIVDLSNPQRQDPNGPAKASLKPNGIGAVGNLDVGWLNSRGTRVERDMEAELWSKAKDILQKEGENGKQSGE